jgi:hypothetical protein
MTPLEAGLHPVNCATCGVEVKVRKNSLAHTSVQWTEAAVRGCVEFPTRHSALVATCTALRASIESAVRAGQLEISDA